MIVVGWHGTPRHTRMGDSGGFMYHDAAAVLLRDGCLIAAIEEERLNRVKHSNAFPIHAIKFCLETAHVNIQDVDAIATDCSEELYKSLLDYDLLREPALPRQQMRDYLAALFETEFGVNVSDKLHFCNHHFAHLLAAWYPSGFADALVLTLDGSGDGASGLIARCSGDEIKVLRHLSKAQSLGEFYSSSICFVGYSRFDEYKVMGLAPYGNPTVYRSMFQQMYRLLPEGRFSLATYEERCQLVIDAGIAWKARRKGEAFTQEHKDFAAALQESLERIVDHVIKYFQLQTRAHRLCVSGGVAHNCTMNGRILRTGQFKHVYIQPAAHDAGNALGAALNVMRENGQPISHSILPHLFWGTNIGSIDEIGQQLARWLPLIKPQAVADVSKAAAKLIAEGAVVGWIQGRSEFGPRALGNRSILADPRPPENKRVINAMIKNRESYRPFAPSVTEERLHDFFDVPDGTTRLPFMIITVFVRSEMRELLGAVTHIDGSARVQSVSRDDNPRYHALIEAFGDLTGVPILLNTSFNNNVEPIVDSIDDAVACFLTTGIQSLVIGDWIIHKTSDILSDPAFLDLVPFIPESQKLVRRCLPSTGTMVFSLDSSVSEFFGESSRSISGDLFRLLLDDVDGASVRRRCARLGFSAEIVTHLGSELLELWQTRAIGLLPFLQR